MTTAAVNTAAGEDIDELEKLLLEADDFDDISAVETAENTTPASQNNTAAEVEVPKSNGFSSILNESLKRSEIEKKSLVHTNDIDSSDDEDVQNFLEQKYNTYGRGVKSLLKQKENEKLELAISRDVDKNIQQSTAAIKKKHEFPVYKPEEQHKKPDAVGIYTDPIFGIRIVHPLLSSTGLTERMTGRLPVTMQTVKKHVTSGPTDKEWAIAGVIVKKGTMKTSKKGSQYMIWQLSDLRGEIKTVSVFLFSNACKRLWKTSQGMVVAILNPTVFTNDGKDNKDEATLSVDRAENFLILGQSKDLGTCKSRKRNGEMCTAVVNLNTCEYCIYHVKQEYGKMSGRSELQSSTSGRGLESLRNKVLGKSEVFYAGQSFTAVTAKKNPKLVAKDQKRLQSLSQHFQSQISAAATNPTTSSQPLNAAARLAENLEINVVQRKKDIDRLKQLADENKRFENLNAQSSGTTSTTTTSITPEQFKNRQFSGSAKVPTLNRSSFTIDLGAIKKSEFAKSKAMAILKKNPIEKSNPNFIKYRGTEKGKKRAHDEIKSPANGQSEATKKQKISDEAEKFRTERIKKIMEAKSSHSELVVAHQNDQQEEYFNKLEKKEAMEEKMLNTFEIGCKAVVCLKCQYTAFSASDHCKSEGHPIKVVDAQKRFFECRDCGGRTATVHRMPKMSCKNCQGSRWQRAAMIKDRKIESVGKKFSIRGDEEMFIGSTSGTANINLCVPIDD